MTLKPGVAYCFRAFYSMISDMVEGSWSHFVRRLNTDLLGTTTDLRTFLFGSDRAALARYRPILEDVQEGPTPWRRYPTDLGHNFVLAHGGCNARKADRLAAEEERGASGGVGGAGLGGVESVMGRRDHLISYSQDSAERTINFGPSSILGFTGGNLDYLSFLISALGWKGAKHRVQ